jgi:hypothetical protein
MFLVLFALTAMLRLFHFLLLTSPSPSGSIQPVQEIFMYFIFCKEFFNARLLQIRDVTPK